MALQNTGSSSGAPIALTAVVAALLQLAIAPQISLFGGAINFMVVLACSLSLSGEPDTAVCVGFFSGLFYDLTSSAPVGLMALLLTLASYVAANASFGMTPGFNVESLRMAGAYILAVNIVYGLALFLLGSETSLLYAVGVHGLVSALLEILVCVPFLVFVGSRTQSGVFSGRGSARKSYDTPARPTRRQGHGAKGSYVGQHGGRASGKRTGSKQGGGLRFKGQK